MIFCRKKFLQGGIFLVGKSLSCGVNICDVFANFPVLLVLGNAGIHLGKKHVYQLNLMVVSGDIPLAAGKNI